MQILNAPGHFSSAPSLVKSDARRYSKLPGVSAFLFTEMADADRAQALVDGFGDGFTVTHGTGLGIGECAIVTRDSARKVIHSEFIRLTAGGGKGRLVRPTYAVAVVTESVATGRRTLITSAHLPAHIEGIWAKIPLPDRLKVRTLFRKGKVNAGIRAWIEAVLNWRRGVSELAAKFKVDYIVVAPDGNVDAHKAWVQEMLGRAWPGLALCVTKDNDLGKRAIGWVLTTMQMVGDGQVFRQQSSDHKAGLYELKHVNAPKPTPKPQAPPPPFQHVVYNGALMDEKTKCAVQTLEAGPLKDLAPLTIEQGCYNPGGVSASAGTHDKGGVLDFAPFKYGRKVKAWRDLCGPAWHRLPIPGLWGEHIHVVMNNEGNLAPAAAAQVVDYFNGLDGLADKARDPNQHHPNVGFDYVPAWHAINDQES